MDKLYSRKRIKLPNFKLMNKFKLLIVIIFFILIFILIVFLYSSYPIFKASCETAAASKSTKIMNEEVTKVMGEYSYSDLISIQKDKNERIVLIEANIVPINEIVSKIISNLQNQIDNMPRTTVYINMGSVTGISILKNIGPKFNIELETAGIVKANLKTEFKPLAINQTLHKIYIELETKIGILTPLSTFSKEITTNVLLTEAVIVGDVPSTYYNFDGISKNGELIEVMK